MLKVAYWALIGKYMKKIVIINSPACDGIERTTKDRFGWTFFSEGLNIEEQWVELEALRETGGVVFARPGNSALRELVLPYLDQKGYISSTGPKTVTTKEHGAFEIFLFAHKLSDEEIAAALKPLTYQD